MKYRLAVFKGADITEDILQHIAGIGGILSHPVAAVGVGADGDDFSSQFLKATEIVRRGQEPATAVYTAGIHLQALPLPNQGLQDFFCQFLVRFKGYTPGCGMGGGLADDVGMYAYRAEVLNEITKLPQSTLELAESLEQLRWLQNGYKIKVGTTECPTIGIDTPEDLQKAESLLIGKKI